MNSHSLPEGSFAPQNPDLHCVLIFYDGEVWMTCIHYLGTLGCPRLQKKFDARPSLLDISRDQNNLPMYLDLQVFDLIQNGSPNA